MRRKKEKDGSISYSYSGDLEKEVQKCKTELGRIEKLLPFLEFSWNEAKKAYESKLRRSNDLKSFIRLAEEKMNEESGGNK